MFFGTGLLLLIDLALVELRFHPHEDCDFAIKLTSDKVMLNNPQWPAIYKSGLKCRWTYECPSWHSCRLRCTDVGLPQTNDCYMDKLLVSKSGDVYFEDPLVYCGRAIIDVKSLRTKISIALITHPKTPGGRFMCTITKDPLSRRSSSVTRSKVVARRRKGRKFKSKKHRLLEKKRKEASTGRYSDESQEDVTPAKRRLSQFINHKHTISKHDRNLHTTSNNPWQQEAENYNGTYEQTETQTGTHDQTETSHGILKGKESQNERKKQTTLQIITEKTTVSNVSVKPKQVTPQISTNEQAESHNELHKQTELPYGKAKQEEVYYQKHDQTELKPGNWEQAMLEQRWHDQEEEPYRRHKEESPCRGCQQAMVPHVRHKHIESHNGKYDRAESKYRAHEHGDSQHVRFEQAEPLHKKFEQTESQSVKLEYVEPPYRHYKQTELQHEGYEHPKLHYGSCDQADSRYRDYEQGVPHYKIHEYQHRGQEQIESPYSSIEQTEATYRRIEEPEPHYGSRERVGSQYERRREPGSHYRIRAHHRKYDEAEPQYLGHGQRESQYGNHEHSESHYGNSLVYPHERYGHEEPHGRHNQVASRFDRYNHAKAHHGRRKQAKSRHGIYKHAKSQTLNHEQAESQSLKNRLVEAQYRKPEQAESSCGRPEQASFETLEQTESSIRTYGQAEFQIDHSESPNGLLEDTHTDFDEQIAPHDMIPAESRLSRFRAETQKGEGSLLYLKQDSFNNMHGHETKPPVVKTDIENWDALRTSSLQANQLKYIPDDLTVLASNKIRKCQKLRHRSVHNKRVRKNKTRLSRYGRHRGNHSIKKKKMSCSCKIA